MIDMAKFFKDLEEDRARFNAEFQKTQDEIKLHHKKFDAEFQKTQIAIEKTRAEVDKMRNQINPFPWIALAIALLGAVAIYLK